jgi:predicted GNAT superfamily acetyltransferase
MVAFGLAIPGIKPGGGYYLHSHMVGVLAEYRNAGIGRVIKLRQREDAIERGIELVEWTFDPLELKNAHFNIVRLGAIVRRYVLNQYGATSSPLHGGLPTDRCVAEWWLKHPETERILSGEHVHREFVDRIAIPSNIAAIRESRPAEARDIQKGVSDRFIDAFGRGLAVTGFEHSDEFGTYLLGPWESK